MNRALVTFLAAAGLATACSNVGPTETIRNDIKITVESESDPNAAPEDITVTVTDVSVLFRGEEGQEYAAMPDADKMQFGDASGSLASAYSGSLAFEADGAVSIDCGIYDVSVTVAEAAEPCVFEANADNPFGIYLCFVDGVWPLSNLVDDGTCPDFFKHSTDR